MGQDIKITAGFDGTAFKRGVTSVKADMKRFAAETAQNWKQAFSVAAAVAGMRELGARMAALKRQSEDIGASTDFLQSLGRMSVKFGGQAEDADNALAKLAETIGQARTEGGAAEEKFTKFGIALYNANGEAKTTEEVFKNVADRYRQASDAATKAAIALEFFGKTGRNINNILGEGAAGIDEYTAQMRRYGLVASETNVARVAEAWADLQANITGAGTSLAGWTLRLLDVQQRVRYFFLGLAGEFSFGNLIDQIQEAISGQGSTAAQRARREDEEAQRRGAEALRADVELGKKNLALEEKLKAEKFAMLSDAWKIVRLEIELKELLDDELDVLATENEEKERMLKIDEKRLQIEKVKADLAEKQAKARQEEEDAINAIDEGFKRDLEQAVLRARGLMVGAGETIRDKMLYTEEEFANANLRGILDPETRRQAAIYQNQVAPLKRKARAQRQRGFVEDAIATQTQAEQIMAGLDRLQSSEQIKQLLELKQVSAATKALARCIVDGNKLNSLIAMAK